jgi:hypothetical protein
MYKSDYGMLCSLSNLSVLGPMLFFLALGLGLLMYAMTHTTTVAVSFFGILSVAIGIWIGILKVVVWMIANAR